MEGGFDKIQDNFDMILNNIVRTQKNLEVCVENFPKLLLDPAIDKEIDKIRSGFYELTKNNQLLIDTLINSKRENEEKLSQLQKSYGDLFLKYQKQQKQIEESEQEIISLLSQTDEQSNYCTNLGATLSSLLWKSSKYPQLINCWLTEKQDSVCKLISITNTTFLSFIDTFSPNLPPLKNDTTEFVMSLLGTIANLTSSGFGRQFLLSFEDGKEFIKQLIKVLGSLAGETGESLAQVVLMILYNVSLNTEGRKYLLELKVQESVVKFIDDNVSLKVRELVLRLVQSLTYDLVDFYALEQVVETLPMGKISAWAGGTDDLAVIAQGIIVNINNSQAKADTCSLVSSV